MSLVYIAGYIIHEDENPDDTFYFYEAYGNFVKDINQGGLTIPGDKVCQWATYCYILFYEVYNETCRSSLCNLLMMLSEFYSLGMQRNHGLTMTNILFNNYCQLYSPHSHKAPKQKLIKLSTK